MKKTGIVPLLLLFFLFGCTPVGQEPASESDGQPEGEESLIPATEVVSEMKATPVDDKPIDTPMPEGDEAEPVTVDLSRLTPGPVEHDDVRVTPSAGIPEPTMRLVQEVKRDLSERLNIDVGAIEVVTVKEVTWRDSSLGCPQPNMNYLQVLTPGFQVVLEAEGKEYFYHSRNADHFILCERGALSVPPIDLEK